MNDTKRKRYAHIQRQLGTPLRVPAGPALERRNYLRGKGLTDNTIVALIAENGLRLDSSTVAGIGRSAKIHRDTHNAIMSVRDEQIPAPTPTKLVDIIGAQRAIQGLMVKGYSMNWISVNEGVYKLNRSDRLYNKTPSHANEIIIGRTACGPKTHIEWRTFEHVYRFALKYELMDPEDLGCSKIGITKARNYAAQHGYVPLHCWDEDTIMDRNAFPNWTGECGTEAGYYLHLKYDIQVKHYAQSVKKRGVMCKPCREARSKGVQQYRKWSDEDRAAILAAVDAKRTVRSVAEEFGCSTRTVERFKRLRREAESSETASHGDVS